MADDNGISIVLTPVQLYAMLNGKSISQGELTANTWYEMPSPRSASVRRFLDPFPPLSSSLPSLSSSRNDARSHQSHVSQRSAPDCWIPPQTGPVDPRTANRTSATLQIIGGGIETVGGVLLILTPEPSMMTKIGGSALAIHGVDTTQAAIRQLFSGRPVGDFTQTGAIWAAHRAGFSGKNAYRIGVVLDVAVPFAIGAGMDGVEKVVAIRAGRVILSEEAVAGKAGRISLDEEEANKLIGKEGGHTKIKHVDTTDAKMEARARRSGRPNAEISRFYSQQLAENAINDAVRVNRYAIQRWAANPASGFLREIEYTGKVNIGRVFSKASGEYTEVKSLRIVFAVATKSNKLFYILSAYPIFD